MHPWRRPDIIMKVAQRKRERKVVRVSAAERRRRQREIEEVVRQRVVSTVRLTVQSALNQEIEGILGRGRYQRADPSDWTRVRIHCNKCDTNLRRHFRRAGAHERSLLDEQWVVTIDVPRLRCRECGGMVSVEFVVLAPYNRLWGNIEERIRELAGLCLSLRDSIEVLAAPTGQPLSPTTLSRRVNVVAELAEALRQGPLEEVPAVAMLDGLWVKELTATEKWKRDKRGRRRRVKRRERFPILVAYGVDPESGRKWVLDWEKGREEDAESWRRLLRRLRARGLCYARGLRLFINDGSEGLRAAFEGLGSDFGVGVRHQRDLFHKLRNVGQAVVGEEGMGRKEQAERRKEVVRDAAGIYESEEREEIERRREGFKAKWQEREPQAVATLERDFEATVSYLAVLEQARREGKEWPVRYLRATGALERAMRSFRQKTRQVVIFHSEKGREAAFYLVVAHRWPPDRNNCWYEAVEQALLKGAPKQKERNL
jgi:transposase-like protein